MTARRAATWTLRGRVSDVVSSCRSALAAWLSDIIHGLALGEDHGSFLEHDAAPADVDRRPGESGSSDAAAVPANASPALAGTYTNRSSIEHVSWGR